MLLWAIIAVIKKNGKRPHYTLHERLNILFHMEAYQIPRRRVLEIAALVWEITKANVDWGRVRIANQLALLNIFIDALEKAFEKHSAPKHMIMDHDPVFTGSAFAELLDQWNVKHRFGAVGKYGSVAVTERVIETLKDEFCEWYNEWRPHMTLDGARPDDVYIGTDFQKSGRDAKKIPGHIERRVFRATRTTGYWLKEAA